MPLPCINADLFGRAKFELTIFQPTKKRSAMSTPPYISIIQGGLMNYVRRLIFHDILG